jgi:hypothetical protein
VLLTPAVPAPDGTAAVIASGAFSPGSALPSLAALSSTVDVVRAIVPKLFKKKCVYGSTACVNELKH